MQNDDDYFIFIIMAFPGVICQYTLLVKCVIYVYMHTITLVIYVYMYVLANTADDIMCTYNSV
jgi:hypothetical protein